jgi:hypothetical protein
MTERYNCGCEAAFNAAGEYLNGSYATWPSHICDEDGWHLAEAYGTLCDRCIPKYDATKCKLGGAPL